MSKLCFLSKKSMDESFILLPLPLPLLPNNNIHIYSISFHLFFSTLLLSVGRRSTLNLNLYLYSILLSLFFLNFVTKQKHNFMNVDPSSSKAFTILSSIAWFIKNWVVSKKKSFKFAGVLLLKFIFNLILIFLSWVELDI